MQKRVAAGDTFDVIIAPPAAIKQFAAAGKVEASGVDVGRVGSGVVVRPGAPVPAVATSDDIKNYTSYIAVTMSAGGNKDAAQALVKFLGGPDGKRLFVAAGIE
ncbi:MAG: substrate-binding domain-containing protein [Burkholderiales bacterium]|nr:substrate-binding domain-containing protein [Burkholderiales bacterium]